jgi:hypothetical protein
MDFTGAEALIDSGRYRGPEGPLFHGADAAVFRSHKEPKAKS